MIKDLMDGKSIQDTFIIASSSVCMSNASKEYLKLTLQDASGTIEARKWEVSDEDKKIFKQGELVEITGDVFMYNKNPQMKVLSGKKVDKSTVDISKYVQSSPIPKEEMKTKLFKYADSIQNNEIKRIVDVILKEKLEAFLTWPAATKNHHEYASGLLHHVTGMLDLGNAICSVYPSINRDLIIAGIILHDIGKITELTDAIDHRYTTEGNLLGHISIMHAYFKRKSEEINLDKEITLVLEHMILSHHGKPEFGSPVTPRIKEAEVLNFIDNLDARMNMMDKELDNILEGEFTKKIFALEDRAFYKPKIK